MDPYDVFSSGYSGYQKPIHEPTFTRNSFTGRKQFNVNTATAAIYPNRTKGESKTRRKMAKASRRKNRTR